MGVKACLLFVLAFGVAACQQSGADLGGGPPDFSCSERCFVDRNSSEQFGRPGDWFFGEKTELSPPEIVYPLEGSVHPVNFEELTVQWRRLDRRQTLFRLRLFAQNLGRRYELYVPCLATGGEGCRYQLPDKFFARVRNECRGDELQLTVDGTDGAGGPVTTSKTVHFRFTEEKLANKGFYYWSSPGGLPQPGRTLRLPVGARRPDPFIQPNTTLNPLGCGGCHAVSRDGSEIAFTARPNDLYGEAPVPLGQLVVASTQDPTKPIIGANASEAGAYTSSMMALTPDGSRVLVTFDGQLELRVVQAAPGQEPGAVIAKFPLLQGLHAFFPEFSPKGDRIVVTLSEDRDSPVKTGSIVLFAYDDQATTPELILRDPVTLVPASPDEFHFYPTWSPDEAYVAFVSAPRGGTNTSSKQKDARLRLVRVADKRQFDLKLATQGVGNFSTLPKFAPFDPAEHGGLMFLTFTSKIDYGLLLRNSIHVDDGRLAQLWLTSIDPERAEFPVDDPSSAPVWLPFQSFVDRSHFGYWTNRVACRLTALKDAQGQAIERCGPGELCIPQANAPDLLDCQYQEQPH